ncbi:MAG: DUF971 domain-containing protein [Ancalomicrobiaceae bacterium]|nr:DUF971 domain-containing protein [Ancalomicrobiaceae bacterium]
MTETAAWPTELRLKQDRRTLVVSFNSGEQYDLPAEFLRVSSPSAEVQGHSPAEHKLQYGKHDVEILGLEPVGNYAVKISFSDLHSSGIYMWDYLLLLGRDQARLWADYLAELEAAGRSR